jgi:hypothetical protein
VSNVVLASTSQFVVEHCNPIALIPFFLARRFLGTPEGMRTLVAALVVAGDEPASVSFVTLDQRLLDAAQREGLCVEPA